jgi:hypothetical protein
MRLAVEEGQKWAQVMIDYILGLEKEVERAGGELGKGRQEEVREAYRRI